MIRFNPKIENIIANEPPFLLFKHKELLCCIVRHNSMGYYCGYVAVAANHPFYGKHYSNKISINAEKLKFNNNYIVLLSHCFDPNRNDNVISLDLAINVHGGLTYSENKLWHIDNDVFNDLWWFGFDTGHYGDLKPYQTEIDVRFGDSLEDKYRDINYMTEQTKLLAEQLYKFRNYKF